MGKSLRKTKSSTVSLSHQVASNQKNGETIIKHARLVRKGCAAVRASSSCVLVVQLANIPLPS